MLYAAAQQSASDRTVSGIKWHDTQLCMAFSLVHRAVDDLKAKVTQAS